MDSKLNIVTKRGPPYTGIINGIRNYSCERNHVLYDIDWLEIIRVVSLSHGRFNAIARSGEAMPANGKYVKYAIGGRFYGDKLM